VHMIYWLRLYQEFIIFIINSYINIMLHSQTVMVLMATAEIHGIMFSIESKVFTKTMWY